MTDRGFWDTIKRPIIGLSPMDGVTDAAFRYITAVTSKPGVIITEFTNVEGLARGAAKMLNAFGYSAEERPIVGQIYGVEEESFYVSVLMLCRLGFDGIDINMGCPANKVARRGSGAGLIRTPEKAKKLIRICKKAALDWSNGITLEEAKVRPRMITAITKMNPQEPLRKLLPVSVKTRIGYDEIVAEEWVAHLLEERPANITVHGRTLKQMYSGEAHWEVLEKAAKVCQQSGITFLGNGDVTSLKDAKDKIQMYGVDGVLVGRATYGNPWFFSGHIPNQAERIEAAIVHSQAFERLLGDRNFWNMRKHLGWYAKGFYGAKDLRTQLMQVTNSQEVEVIFEKYQKGIRESG